MKVTQFGKKEWEQNCKNSIRFDFESNFDFRGEEIFLGDEIFIPEIKNLAVEKGLV